jgi:drug/metabolite transporter (DMT)-like permease
MPLRLLIIAVTVNAVISQLLLRRASSELGTPAGLPGLPDFVGRAALSPWILGSVTLQVIGYVLWIIVISRAKLGVATASVGAGFYTLTALSAWLIYGETLSAWQLIGIGLVTLGVGCIGLGQS